MAKQLQLRKFFHINNNRKCDKVSKSDSSDDVETPSVKRQKVEQYQGELYCHIIQSYASTLNMINECDK